MAKKIIKINFSLHHKNHRDMEKVSFCPTQNTDRNWWEKKPCKGREIWGKVAGKTTISISKTSRVYFGDINKLWWRFSSTKWVYKIQNPRLLNESLPHLLSNRIIQPSIIGFSEMRKFYITSSMDALSVFSSPYFRIGTMINL